MRTYYLDISGSKEISIKAENIDNLRKKLIREYDANIKRYSIRVKVLVGPKYGSHYKVMGYLHYHENQAWRYDPSPSGYYWMYNGKARRVSPKTGKLLDVNSHTRRL